MYKYFLFAVALCSMFIAESQNSFVVVLRNATYAADNEKLPFWFTANRNGKLKAEGSYLNVSEFYVGQSKHPNTSSLGWSWGADIVAGMGKENFRQLNQLFAELSFKKWELKGGMYHDTLRFSGLSSTNGNIMRSMNARPYPMLRLSSGQNIPVPFTENLISFNIMYSEGILNDNRFVHNARLHQKSFHLMINPADLLKIMLGFEHCVMWGGVSASNQTGKLPQDFYSYLRYITGSRGSSDFPKTDQMNVAGNQLGAWKLEVEKKFISTTATFYLNHPFEDFSGVNLRNWRDNLLGIHIHFKRGKPVNTFLYEYTNTRQQSIRDSLYSWNETEKNWIRLENDNYLNHSIYRSGYTYYQQVMASPLFFPVIMDNGMARGIRSTRFFAHHAGLAGNISNHLKWKGMATYIKHFGSYTNPHQTPVEQFSGMLEMLYSNHAFPFEIGLAAAADSGTSLRRNRGISLTLSKKW